MDDCSKSALHGRGLARQEEMRKFLGCDEPPKDEKAYDFSKGKVRFEYKSSELHLRNERSAERPKRRPTKGWSFSNLRGQGGKKTFDYLILEGSAEGSDGLIVKSNDRDQAHSYYFLISFNELSETPFGEKNTFTVTLPMSGGQTGRRRGLNKQGVSKFVWDHQFSRDELKSDVERLALAIEGAGASPTAGIPGESDNPNPQAEEKRPPKSEPPTRKRGTGGELISQLSIPFKSV